MSSPLNPDCRRGREERNKRRREEREGTEMNDILTPSMIVLFLVFRTASIAASDGIMSYEGWTA